MVFDSFVIIFPILTFAFWIFKTIHPLRCLSQGVKALSWEIHPLHSFEDIFALSCAVCMLTPVLLTSADDKILIQMGAVREGQTTEERKAYLTGLKEIINEMRRDKVKDFSIVASEIAAYRRRFLQDPSRVLSL